MGDVDVQLRLRPEKRNRPSTIVDVDVGDRLLGKHRGLNVGQRLEFALRAPAALERVIDRIAHLDSLTNQEVEHALIESRQDVADLEALRARRTQCATCGTHQANGHTLGCPAAS
jgi:hypothetical protein